MSQNLRGNYTQCCAVCARTCWVYNSYKVFVSDVPPICKAVLKCPTVQNLTKKTMDFYNISGLIKDPRYRNQFEEMMLSRDSLVHPRAPKGTPQYFYFCKTCAKSLGAQTKKPPHRRLKPKFAIANYFFTGQINIDDLRKINFIESQMFSRIHNIGYAVNIFSKGMRKFGLQHSFDVTPTLLFRVCPIPPWAIHLRVVLTGAFTKEERILKLKPHIMRKP